MISGNTVDPNNQHYRFCVAVARSSYFGGKLGYPEGTWSHPCVEREILFRTSAGMQEAGGERYFERVSLCCTKQLKGSAGEIIYTRMYISRAYESDKMFYLLAPSEDGTYHIAQRASDEKVYLENLSTNLSIVDVDENE